MNVVGIFDSWNPLSYTQYSPDKNVIEPNVSGLVKTGRQVNHARIEV